ncbi:MAG: type II toxin-antitoxin system Phd/YefM family antitoxin [Nitrospira sp.]|nr:type II toxin-antitoxin system Phd/YefM family antitoxin [Nitrospira sp.]
METIGAFEAKTHLSALLDRVSKARPSPLPSMASSRDAGACRTGEPGG